MLHPTNAEVTDAGISLPESVRSSVFGADGELVGDAPSDGRAGRWVSHRGRATIPPTGGADAGNRREGQGRPLRVELRLHRSSDRKGVAGADRRGHGESTWSTDRRLWGRKHGRDHVQRGTG